MNSPLLMLCHRIPFPPDKGDKIRSYHLLRELSRDHAIVLGAFVDDPNDWQYRDQLEALCAEVYLEWLPPLRARIKSLSGMLGGQALSLPYYRSSRMAEWVERMVDRYEPANVIVYSSPMAQYVLDERFRRFNRIMDFVDVDSDKWRQYAESKHWPASWIYRREARKLLDFEKRVGSDFDQVFFVSEAEARLFSRLAPGLKKPVRYYNNGVDTRYFSPDIDVPVVDGLDGRYLVFTGAMDYWPNIEAVVWFVEQVLPGLRRQWPGLRFFIVGSKPTDRVRALADEPGVSVTGRVPDVRPYLRNAWAVVAPLRIARGIQNKVLEGMAMGLPVVATSAALEGIHAEDGLDVLVADDASAFLERLKRLDDPSFVRHVSAAARRRVVDDYAWKQSVKPLIETLRQ